MSSNFHVFLPELPCTMSLSTPPVSWMLPESDIPLAIQPRKSYNKSINCAFYIISGCGCRMDTYAYLAHLTEDGRTQTILEHLKGTASLCSAFAAAFDAEAQGHLAGMAHDIGKYSAAFQRRLPGGCFCDLRTPRRPPRRRRPGRRRWHRHLLGAHQSGESEESGGLSCLAE